MAGLRYKGGSFKIGIGRPTFRDKRDSCSTRRCDALCKNDYDVCYVDECGGRIYEAQQEPKPRPDSGGSQASG